MLVPLCTTWTHSARWRSMIMASALLFGEITAVVFTANKAPGGAQRSDSVSLNCSRLLGGDPPLLPPAHTHSAHTFFFLNFLSRPVSLHAEGEDFPPARVNLVLWLKGKTSGDLQQNSAMMDDL